MPNENYDPNMRSNQVTVGSSGGFGATLTAPGLTANRAQTLPNVAGEVQVNQSGSQRLPFGGDGAGLAPLFALKLNVPNDDGPVTVPFSHEVCGLYGDVTNNAVGETLDVSSNTGYTAGVPADAAGVFWGVGNAGLRAANSAYSAAASGGGVQGDVYLLIAPRASS